MIEMKGWKTAIEWDDFEITTLSNSLSSTAHVTTGIGVSEKNITSSHVAYDASGKMYHLAGLSIVPLVTTYRASLAKSMSDVEKRFLLAHERVHYAIFRAFASALVAVVNQTAHPASQHSTAAAEGAAEALGRKLVTLLTNTREKAKSVNDSYEVATRGSSKTSPIDPKAQLSWTSKIRKYSGSGLTNEDEEAVLEYLEKRERSNKRTMKLDTNHRPRKGK